jgi:anti-sigma factor RsiW
LDGEADDSIHLLVERHLAECSECSAQADRLSHLDAALVEVVTRTGRIELLNQREECLHHEALCGYLDNFLPHEEKVQMDQHLAFCDACLSEVLQLRRIRNLLASAPLEQVPSQLATEVSQQIREPIIPSALQRLAELVLEFSEAGVRLVQSSLISSQAQIAVAGRLVPVPVFRSEPGEAEAFPHVDLEHILGSL